MIKMILQAMTEIQRNKPTAYLGECIFVPFDIDFKTPATINEINNFERETGCALPNDYKEFLQFSNGAIFPGSGDSTLFDINSIIEVKEIMDYKKGGIRYRKLFGRLYSN